jgi:hypothetical protein
VSARQVVGPDGRAWTIRERWLPRMGGLPSDPELDDLGADVLPPFFLLDLLRLVVALPLYLLRLLLAPVKALFGLAFLPPWIEAEHVGPPYSRMTWRAADRHIGPSVIDQIAAAIERGDERIRVEGARFLGFATRPDDT